MIHNPDGTVMLTGDEPMKLWNMLVYPNHYELWERNELADQLPELAKVNERPIEARDI